jgi:hypothetical protein
MDLEGGRMFERNDGGREEEIRTREELAHF